MKYLKIFLALQNVSLKRYLENRGNALGNIVVTISDLLLTLFFIEVIFFHTPEIKGWSKYQVIFLVGVSKIALSLFTLFFYRSVHYMSRYIRKGELDIFLTKPINSQFYLSFLHTRVHEILGILSGVIVVVYALQNLGNLTGGNLLELGIALLCGLIIFYSLYFILATLSIWFGRFTALPELFYMSRDPLSIPIDFLGSSATFFLTFVVPLIFVVTIPVKLFLDKSSAEELILSVSLSLILLGFSNWFWKFALRHYTSASS